MFQNNVFLDKFWLLSPFKDIYEFSLLMTLRLDTSVQAVGCWITWIISSWEESNFYQTVANSEDTIILTPIGQMLSFWVKIVAIFWISSALATVIFVSALEKSRILTANCLDRCRPPRQPVSATGFLFNALGIMAKGQKNSKWLFQVSRHFLQKTNKRVLLYYYEISGLLVFFGSFEEIEDSKETFRNYLTLRSHLL